MNLSTDSNQTRKETVLFNSLINMKDITLESFSSSMIQSQYSPAQGTGPTPVEEKR
jgi:hypothetical protein